MRPLLALALAALVACAPCATAEPVADLVPDCQGDDGMDCRDAGWRTICRSFFHVYVVCIPVPI